MDIVVVSVVVVVVVAVVVVMVNSKNNALRSSKMRIGLRKFVYTHNDLCSVGRLLWLCASVCVDISVSQQQGEGLQR